MQIKLLKYEINQSMQLASPLVAALLAQIMMEIVNSLMLGRLGPSELAAGGMGMATFFMLLVLCIGLFSSTGVLIARSYGAKDRDEIKKYLIQALYLACFLAVPFVILLWNMPVFLLIIGELPNVVLLAKQFLHGLVFGVPALLLFFALREFVCALSFTKIIMLLSLFITPINALFNYILMYGKLGLPAMGIAGIGYSTAFMQWLLLLSILIYIHKNSVLRGFILFSKWPLFEAKRLWEMVKLGAPVSVTMGLEAGLFSVTTLMMGYFGVESLAAHQIALQCATFAFMFPLGISQATAIRVGQNLGKGSVQSAKYAGYAGMILGLSIALITAIICILFPKVIISLFIETQGMDHQHLIQLATQFLSVMALFQLLDALQVIMNGALRGLKDTLVPMWLGLLSYWIAGLLSGYYLAFVLRLGGVGLWWGLGIGISISGILLYWRFHYRIQYEEKLNKGITC